MSERYSKLYALPENLYAAGSPVVIAAGALLKDNQTGKVIAQLKMRNISQKPIKAAMVSIRPLDTVGNPLGEKIEYQYLDLSAARDEDFGQKVPVALPDAATRSFTASVEEIVFADNSIWTATGEPWEVLDTPGSLRSIGDAELIKQFRIKYGNNCKNLPLIEKDLWYCACGELNRQGEAECHSCQKSFALLKQIDMDELRKERDIRVAAEKEQAEKEAAAAKAHAKKKGKIAAIVAPILAVLIVVAVLVSNFIEKKQEEAARLEAYNTAVVLMDAGQYDEAIKAFNALGDYKDCYEKIKHAECEKKYFAAISLLEEKQFDKALKAFESMDGYRDSEEQIYEVKYLWALHYLAISEDRNAYDLLTELADLGYKDSDSYLADFLYLPSSISRDGSEKIFNDYDTHGNIVSGYLIEKPSFTISVNKTFTHYTVSREYEYTYNKDGSYVRKLSSSNGQGVTLYNSKGQCISESSVNAEYAYEYYDNGRFRKMTYLVGDKVSWVREYSEDGTFIATSYEFSFLNDNKKCLTDNYNNITRTGDVRCVYQYDENGNLVHMEKYQGNTKAFQSDFFYDEQGNLFKDEGINRGNNYSIEFAYEYDYFYCPEAVK